MTGAWVILAAAGPEAFAQQRERIPFSAILAEPGNAELNVAFAEQQVAEGDLPGAASTLERLLIADPSLNQVRLLYAIVLYRLGQVTEAEAEFAAVDEEELTPENRALLVDFTDRVRRSLNTWSGNVGVTAGFNYDTNLDSFPVDGLFRVELPGVGSALIESGEDGEDDVGFFGIIDGQLDWNTPIHRVERVRFEGALLGVKQVELDEFDVGSGFLGVSAVIDATAVDVLPAARIRQIQLGGDRYLRSGEGGVRIEREIGRDRRLVAFAEAVGGYDDFAGVEVDPFGNEKTGPFVAATAGIVYTPVDRLSMIARYRYGQRFADEDFEAFTSHGIAATAQYILSDEAALWLSADYTRSDYDAPDPFVSATTAQEDNAVSGGIGLLLRADGLLELAGVEEPAPAFENMTLNLGGRYRRVFSNLENYEYQNFRFEFSVTKRFFF